MFSLLSTNPCGAHTLWALLRAPLALVLVPLRMNVWAVLRYSEPSYGTVWFSGNVDRPGKFHQFPRQGPTNFPKCYKTKLGKAKPNKAKRCNAV